MMTEEMLAEILTRLEEMNAQLRSMVEPPSASPCHPPPTPSPASSTSILTADSEDREIRTSTISTKPSATSSTELIPSSTSAPPHDADLVSTDGDLCILFNTDDGDVDRLSRLPDLLLRDIVARLPLKDAGRMAVLSRRWSPIWPRQRRAAPLFVDHTDLAIFRLESDHLYEPSSPDELLEQIRLQLEWPHPSAPRQPVNHDPSAYTAARAGRLPWFRASRSVPSRRCCSPSRESALEFLITTYDPGAGFAGSARVGIYFDTEKAEHTRVRTFAMSLLRRSTHIWPADLRTGVGTDIRHLRAAPIGSSEFLSTMHTRCLMLCLYQTLGNELHNISAISASSEDLVLSCPAARTSNAGKVFKLKYPWLPSGWVWSLRLGNFSLQLISVWSQPDIGDMTVRWLDMLTTDRSVNYNNHKSKCGCIEIARHILIVGVITVICSHKEENWFMVYISVAFTLDFWWLVALFQSYHHAILSDFEAWELSYGWIITDKLLNSSNGRERDGFSFGEDCLAMHGDMVVELVLPAYQQYSLCVHLLADTRRTMLHFNQDKQLMHYERVPQPTPPLSFLLACNKIQQSSLGNKIGDSPGFFNYTNKVVLRAPCFNITVMILPIVLMKASTLIISEILPFDSGLLSVLCDITLWTSSQGHTDAPAADVSWSFHWVRSSFEERRKWWLHQKLIIVLWISISKVRQVLLWDPGGASSGIDPWSVHWLSNEFSNGVELLLPHPRSPSALQFHKCIFVFDHTTQWKNDSDTSRFVTSSKQEVFVLKPPWPPPAWICLFGVSQFVEADRNYGYMGSELYTSTWKAADQILHKLSSTRQTVLYIVKNEWKPAGNNSTDDDANTLGNLSLVSMLYDHDKELSLGTNTAKSRLKEGSVSSVQVWNDVSLTLTTDDFQVLWDPVGFEDRHRHNLIGLGTYDIRMNSNKTNTSLLMDLTLNIIWATRKCYNMLQVVSASQSQVPWDPGISEVLQISNIATHGLGQAVFQGGKYVIYLLVYG